MLFLFFFFNLTGLLLCFNEIIFFVCENVCVLCLVDFMCFVFQSFFCLFCSILLWLLLPVYFLIREREGVTLSGSGGPEMIWGWGNHDQNIFL